MPIAKVFGGQKLQKEADLTLDINGSRTVFSLPENIDTTTLRVFVNGLMQRYGDTITAISVSSFTLSYAPTIGEALVVLYVPL